MSIRLACDQCGKDAETLFEIRAVVASREGQFYRSDYADSQVHWECIVPFVGRRDAENNEVPF